jgi:hypothetical protein
VEVTRLFVGEIMEARVDGLMKLNVDIAKKKRNHLSSWDRRSQTKKVEEASSDNVP